MLILRSVARLLEDVLAKEKQALAASTPPPDAFVKLDHDKFLNIYLQLLRRIYGMETSQQPRPVEDQRSDGESCSGTSRAHSPSPSRAAYDHRIRDQYLLLLEIVALLMEANGRDMVRFDALFGWDVLETGIVRSCDVGDLSLHLDFDVSPLDVVDMCTWMLKEYTVTAVEQDVAAQRSSPEKNDRSRCSSRASRCSVEHIIPVEPPVAPMTRCMRVLAAVTSTDPTSLPSSPSMSSASLAHDDVVFPSLDGGLGSAASPPSTAACASTADSGVVQLEHGHPLYWGLCSKIVGMFSMLFRHDHGKEDMEVAEMLRSTFCNNDGFEMLMNLLRHAANRRHLLPPGFMVKILTTLVDLVSCSDATKLYVCDTIGLDRVLAYLRDTGMLAERASWELLVHLAVATRSPWSFSALFRGKTLVARDDGFCGVDPDSDSMRNLMDVASDCASGSNITNAISETVQRCIQDIVTPHILFDAPLRPCAGRTFDINVIPLHTAGLHTRSGSDVTKTTDQSQSSPGILPRNGRFLRHHRSQGSIGAFAPITCEDTKTVRPSASAMFLRPLTNLVSQVTSGVTSGSTVIVDGAGRSHSKRRSHDRKSSQDRREVKGLDMRLPAHISVSQKGI